jgi:hypothetical protein
MRSLRRTSIALLFGGAASGAMISTAAADDTEQGYQTRLAAQAHGPLYKSLWMWGDSTIRLNARFQPTVFRVSPGLSWRALPTLFLTGAYAWTPQWRQVAGSDDWSDREFVDEHRLWQQLMWTPKSAAHGWSATIRVREEQRFRPHDDGGVGHRLRVMVRGQVPVARRANVSFVQWTELFIGWNEPGWGQPRGVDQQRIFVGVAWQAVPTLVRLEAGYLVQWLLRSGPDTVNHMVSLSAAFGWSDPPRRRRHSS